MKRCPECRRDYYDDTLLYCLDDGNALLEGTAKGQFHEAIAEGEKARELNDDPFVMGYLGRAYAGAGKRDEATKMIGDMKEAAKHRYVPAYGVANVYVELGDKDQAFQWLERSLQDRAWDTLFLKVDPRMEPLHSDQRFADLVYRIGLL